MRKEKLPIVNRFTHQGIDVRTSAISKEEQGFIKQAIDFAAHMEPELPDRLEKITYQKRVIRHSDPDFQMVQHYLGSQGRHTYRADKPNEPGWITVVGAPSMEDAIGVLAHELTHVIMHIDLLRKGKNRNSKIGRREVHPKEFFLTCAEMYRAMGCTEVAPLHDMLVYKSSKRVHMSQFPEHADWYWMMLDYRQRSEWKKMVDEFAALVGDK